MADFIIYLTKSQTGLPFDVEQDVNFSNYRAKHDNGAREKLTTQDIINIHIILELRKKKNK